MSNSLQKGFLLTRQVQDTGKGLQLSYWVKGNNGAVKLTVDGEKAIFFVETAVAEQAKEILENNNIPHKVKVLELKTFKQKQVSAFYFVKLSLFYKARDILKSQHIKCYEDDIRPEDRFLMERFITGSMEYVGYQQQNYNYQHLHSVKCKSSQYHPTLSMLSIDIECAMDGELFSIGCYSDTSSKVFMIGSAEQNADDYIEWVDDETDLLLKFIAYVIEIDPDIIIGWNVINFDFKLLQKRCDINNIKFAIGRDGTSPYWRQNKLSPEQNFILIPGRVVLDGIDLLKSATYNFASFSLENVAQELLGMGKVIEDVDNRMAEIVRKFNYDKQALAKYNLEDCRLVWLIFEKTQLLDFAILRSTLTGLELDRVGGSVAAFTNLYLPKLHRSGYVAPNMGDGVSDLVSPGGFVMDSKPGLYKNVLVLDFKSLYPSIIRTFNIDPMGMIEGLKEYELQASDEQPPIAAMLPIPGFDGAYFSRDKHFLPKIINELWAERDKAKLQRNAPLSQAIKIIMNSFYGILGSTGCRFFDPRLSGSITKRSHQLLNTTKDWIEDQGYSVIYGDTDSIFVSVGADKSDQECQDIGKEMMNYINQRWDKELKDKYALDSHLEIEFETHFNQFLMPTIRGQDVGTKKRYAGLVGRGDKQKLIFKGLESVRTDWTELAKVFQKTLYMKVFNQEPVEQYVLDMVADTFAGKFDNLLVYRKRLRRKLVEYTKNVPPHVQAARFADDKNKKAGKPLRYQNKGWIEYVMTVNGPQTIEYLTAPIDYQLYIDRQLGAVADGILPFIGKRFDEICDDQMLLF
ncbi:DNA polymerase II [Thalassomonas sp. M1454]|uniref:DNA polymerase II n=1 Tax=Thalassomonas sp. M1454 TaxID=2594477 RepID=UPI0011812064|nr:DNA polymerase II [Thalassomonas sp. M1454]TRX56942.1 DNA polymerase II [Thalassomonas sp. M1454]